MSKQLASAMFVLNTNGHYFEVNTQEIGISKELLNGCRFFEDEKALLEVVCSEGGFDLEEVAGSTYYITVRRGQLVVFDDRGFASTVDEPTVESFIANFTL